MNNITTLLHKEWLEFKQQRALLFSIIFVPIVLTLIPLIALYAIGYGFVAKGAKRLKKIEEV